VARQQRELPVTPHPVLGTTHDDQDAARGGKCSSTQDANQRFALAVDHERSFVIDHDVGLTLQVS
jgi:hypothetical protein